MLSKQGHTSKAGSSEHLFLDHQINDNFWNTLYIIHARQEKYINNIHIECSQDMSSKSC